MWGKIIAQIIYTLAAKLIEVLVAFIKRMIKKKETEDALENATSEENSETRARRVNDIVNK